MDIAFVFGIVALWGVMSWLVVGFEKLEKPTRGRA